MKPLYTTTAVTLLLAAAWVLCAPSAYAHGIALDSANGSFTVNGTTSVANAAGNGIRVQNSGGTIGFGDTTVTGSTNTGVSLSNNSGMIGFGDLDVDTSGANQVGVFGSNAGTVNTASGTINAGTNTAVDISDTALGMTLTSVTSSGGSSPGLDFANTSGSFTVTGSGTTDGSGGTISNKLDQDGIQLFNTQGPITLKNMNIESIRASSDSTDGFGTRTFIDGIHGEQVLGGLVLDNVFMNDFSDNAINGATFGGSFPNLGRTVWDGLEIRNSTIQNSNRFAVSGKGDSSDEALVRIVGLRGTVVVDNSTLQLGAELMDIFTDLSGTLDMTVQRSNFLDGYKEFSSGGVTSVGKRGIDVTAEGGGDVVARIGDPNESDPALGNTFRNNRTASIFIAGQTGSTNPHTGNIDTVISQNTFLVTDHTSPQQSPGNFVFNFPQGGVALNPSGGTFDAIVSNNLFDEVMHGAGGIGQLNFTFNTGNGVSNAIVRGNEFRLPWDAPVFIQADGNNSAALLLENNTYTDGVVGSATDDLGQEFPSPFNPVRVFVRNGGSLDLTLDTEDLPQQDDQNGGGQYSFIADVQNQAGNNLDLYITNSKSPDGYRFTQSAGAFNLYRENASDTTAAAIIDGNNNTGGGGVAGVPNPAVDGDNTDPPVVSTSGTITPTDTQPTQPSVTIP